MTPVSILWFWRGLKGHSITFAGLFASVVLGASIAGGLRHLLSALGVHWLYVLILPTILFAWTSRREALWLPDERKRRLIARSLLLGSLAFALLFAWLRPTPPARHLPPARATPTATPPPPQR